MLPALEASARPRFFRASALSFAFDDLVIDGMSLRISTYCCF